MSDERVDWKILGRNIGTATGWDQFTDNTIILYEFEPKDGIRLPKGDLVIGLEDGLFETYNDAGNVSFSGDAIEILEGTLRETKNG